MKDRMESYLRGMITTVCLFCAGFGTALACTCPPLPNAAAQAEEWDLVALGTVVSTDNDEAGNSALIAMDEVFKGEASAAVMVSSGPSNPMACGLSYRQGDDVIVLANEQGEGQFSNYFCAIPQFGADAFRAAFSEEAANAEEVEPPATATLSSPVSGDVIQRNLLIEGEVPHDWFFEGSVQGELRVGDEAVSQFPLEAKEDDWWTPGLKTVSATIVLQNTEIIDVVVRVSEANAADGAQARAISVPVTLIPIAENTEDLARAAVIHAKTVEWFGYYAENDADGLSEFLSDDFVLIGADGSVSTKDDEVTFLREVGWAAPIDFEYHVDGVIFPSAAVAIVYGHATSTRMTGDAQPCRHSYMSSNVLKANGDEWRPVSSHVSGVQCVPIDSEAGSVGPE